MMPAAVTTLDLQDGFPPADWAAWEAVARKALDQAFEVTHPSGFPLRALYGPQDAIDHGAPGTGDGVRGFAGPRAQGGGLAAAVEYREPNSSDLAAAITHDGPGGLEEAWVALDGDLFRGAAPTPTSAADLGWLPDDPLELAGLRGLVWAGAAAPALGAHLGDGAVAVADPLAALLRGGALGVAWEAAWDRLVETLDGPAPARVVPGVDGTIWHEAGARPEQEIAGLVSAALETLRACQVRGRSPARVAPGLLFRVAVAPDVGISVAKIRALRGLWSRVLLRMGLDPTRHAPRLVARGSRRHRTGTDVWTNLLRGTLEAFAASCGGAEAAALPALDEAVGVPGPVGRRMARNTLLLLRHECGLDRVADPLGGAFGLEAHTQALMEAAWSRVRELEGAGGLLAALADGAPQREVAEAEAAEADALARGEAAVVGVTLHPAPDLDRPGDARVVDRGEALAAHLRAGGGTSPVAAELATWGAWASGDPRVTPLEPRRLSAPHEPAPGSQP